MFFFCAQALIKSICLRVGIGNQNWMDHSHHSGKVRNWWEHWQVYVTDVEFIRDGTILVYIEKCRDWFRTYHYVVLAFSWLPQLSFCAFSAPKGPWKKAGESCWRSGYIYVARAIVCLGGEPEADLGKLQVGSPETWTRKLWWQVGRDLCMQWPSLDKTWWGDIIQIMLDMFTFDTLASQKLVIEEIRVILCRSFHTVSIHTWK